MDAVVIAAMIESLGTVIAAAVAGFLGYRWLNQQRLNEELADARSDILFLLEVERIHAQHRNAEHPYSPLRETRALAKERGYFWSKKNARSRIDGRRSS